MPAPPCACPFPLHSVTSHTNYTKHMFAFQEKMYDYTNFLMI